MLVLCVCQVRLLSILLLICRVVLVVVEVWVEQVQIIRLVIFLGVVRCWMIELEWCCWIKVVLVFFMFCLVFCVFLWSILVMFLVRVGLGSIVFIVILVLVRCLVRLCDIERLVVLLKLQWIMFVGMFNVDFEDRNIICF